MHKELLRRALFAILIGLPMACSTTPEMPIEPDLPGDRLEILDTWDLDVDGRPFVVLTLASEIEDKIAVGVQIQGDGVILVLPAEGVGEPMVGGNRVEFGGQVVEITDQPNRFLVNGTATDVAAGGVYGVLKGDGVRRLR